MLAWRGSECGEKAWECPRASLIRVLTSAFFALSTASISAAAGRGGIAVLEVQEREQTEQQSQAKDAEEMIHAVWCVLA